MPLSLMDTCRVCGCYVEFEDAIALTNGTCGSAECEAAAMAEDYEGWLDDRLDRDAEITGG